MALWEADDLRLARPLSVRRGHAPCRAPVGAYRPRGTPWTSQNRLRAALPCPAAELKDVLLAPQLRTSERLPAGESSPSPGFLRQTDANWQQCTDVHDPAFGQNEKAMEIGTLDPEDASLTIHYHLPRGAEQSSQELQRAVARWETVSQITNRMILSKAHSSRSEYSAGADKCFPHAPTQGQDDNGPKESRLQIEAPSIDAERTILN